jgi:hypothetical protein
MSSDAGSRSCLTDSQIVEIEEKRRKSRVNMFIPPPNPLLPKAMLPEEPLRNGFLKKFM